MLSIAADGVSGSLHQQHVLIYYSTVCTHTLHDVRTVVQSSSSLFGPSSNGMIPSLRLNSIIESQGVRLMFDYNVTKQRFNAENCVGRAPPHKS